MAVLAQDLRDAVLQTAMQGKLTKQLLTDTPVDELLKQIKEEKEKLIKEKKIKKEKELPCIDKNDIPFNIPESWKWVTFSDIFYKITDGTHKTPKYTQNGVHFLSVKDMSDGHINLSNTKFISEKEHKELFARCNPEKGDLLVTKVGTTGIPVIVDIDEEFSLFVSVALLKFNHSLLNVKYLFYAIKSPCVYQQSQLNTRGVGNKNWVLDAIKTTIIPLPPLEEQQRIVNKIEELMAKIDEYEKIEKRLEEIKKQFPIDLRDSLLQAAMQGKLTEQLPTDSSVDNLLDKIKEERKKLEDKDKIKKSSQKSALANSYELDIPNRWQKINITDICSMKQWATIPTKDLEKSGYPVYGANGIIGYSKKWNHEIETLLITCRGSTCGYTNITQGKCYVNGNALSCDYLTNYVNIYFLKYFIESLDMKQLGIITGSAQPQITQDKISKLYVPLPPLEEQERIVDTLNKLLPLINNL